MPLITPFMLWLSLLASDPSFLVLPVHTDLQRLLLDSPEDLRALAFVRGCALGENVPSGVTPIQLGALESELKPLASENATVYFRVVLAGSGEPNDIDTILKRVGERAGFARQIPSHSFRSPEDGWSSIVSTTLAGPDDKDAREDHTGEEHLEVYRVATRLSRILAEGADCVVDLRVTLEESDSGFVPPGLGETISQILQDLEIERREIIFFRVRHLLCKKDGDRRLFEDLEKLAKDLAFTSMSATIVSEEDIRCKELLGKPAPELTLESFETGKPASLRSLIAGKLTLLKFWGYG
jgi:hypothetical protein